MHMEAPNRSRGLPNRACTLVMAYVSTNGTYWTEQCQGWVCLLRGQHLQVHHLITERSGGKHGHISRPVSQDDVRVSMPEFQARFVKRKGLQVPYPPDGGQSNQRRRLHREEYDDQVMLSYRFRLHKVVVRRDRSHINLQGGRRQPSFQPFLEEGEHRPDWAFSGIFSTRTPGPTHPGSRDRDADQVRSGPSSEELAIEGLSQGAPVRRTKSGWANEAQPKGPAPRPP
ncbi:hypothetical protein PO909_006212 [Leuciscus waleckii]